MTLGGPKQGGARDLRQNQLMELDVLRGVDQNSRNLLQVAASNEFNLKHYLISHEPFYQQQLLARFRADLQGVQGATRIVLFVESWNTSLQGRSKEERETNHVFHEIRTGQELREDPHLCFPKAQEFRASLQFQLAHVLKDHPARVEVQLLDTGNKYHLNVINQARAQQADYEEHLKRLIAASPAELERGEVSRQDLDAKMLLMAREIIYLYALQLNGNRNERIQGRILEQASVFKEGEVGFVFTGAGHLGVVPQLLRLGRTAFEFILLPEAVLKDLPQNYRYSFSASSLEQAGVNLLANKVPDLNGLRNIVCDRILSYALESIVSDHPPTNDPVTLAYRRGEVAEFYAGLLRSSLHDPKQLYQLVKSAVDHVFEADRERCLIDGVVGYIVEHSPFMLDRSTKESTVFYRKIREQVFGAA